MVKQVIIVFLLFFALANPALAMEKISKEEAKQLIREKLENLDREQDEIIKAMFESFKVVRISDGLLCPGSNYFLYKNKEKVQALARAKVNFESRFQNEENNISDNLSDFTEEEKQEIRTEIEDMKVIQGYINNKIELLRKNNYGGKIEDEVVDAGSSFRFKFGRIAVNMYAQNRDVDINSNETIRIYKKAAKKFEQGEKRYREYQFNLKDPHVVNEKGIFINKKRSRKKRVSVPPIDLSSNHLNNNNNRRNRRRNISPYFWPAIKITGCLTCLVLVTVLASKFMNWNFN